MKKPARRKMPVIFSKFGRAEFFESKTDQRQIFSQVCNATILSRRGFPAPDQPSTSWPFYLSGLHPNCFRQKFQEINAPDLRMTGHHMHGKRIFSLGFFQNEFRMTIDARRSFLNQRSNSHIQYFESIQSKTSKNQFSVFSQRTGH